MHTRTWQHEPFLSSSLSEGSWRQNGAEASGAREIMEREEGRKVGRDLGSHKELDFMTVFVAAG